MTIRIRMHASTIYSKTKTIAVVAVAFLMVVAAAAVVLSSESTADATDKYTVTVNQITASGSNTSTYQVTDGSVIKIDENKVNKLYIGKIAVTMSTPEDTTECYYEFSGWYYIDPDGESIEVTTEGIQVHSNITVVGQIGVFTQMYDVSVAPNDESFGTVEWFDHEGKLIEGSTIKASYMSEIYTEGNVLYVNDLDAETTYTAVATPAAMTEEDLYFLSGWDLEVPQVLDDVPVTAIFSDMETTIEYLGVVYKILDENLNVTAIGFNEESGFKSIEIPDNFQLEGLAFTFTPVSVNAEAFSDCRVADKASIGANVAEIGFMAFTAPYLVSITVDEDNESYSSDKGVLYDKDVKTLLQYPLSKQRYVIPETVTAIGDCAFANAGAALKADGAQASGKYITYISIPSNVKTIGNAAFWKSTIECLKFEDGVKTLGEDAFSSCNALNYIVFPYTIENVGPNAFEGCVFHDDNGEVMEYSAEDFKGYKFTSSTNSKALNLYVPAKNGSIRQDGYNYRIVNAEDFVVKVCGFVSDSIAEVSIPETITYLGFEYKVSGILSKAFYGDNTITSVKCYGDIGNKAFANCSNLKTVTVGNASVIGDYAFENCVSLDSANFEDSVAKIGKRAFYECTSLKEFDLSNVYVIEERAFARCPLTEANLVNAVDIGPAAFTEATLVKVVFSNDLSNLDSRAFYGYTFYDLDGNKLKATAENMAGKAFTGEGATLNQVLL